MSNNPEHEAYKRNEAAMDDMKQTRGQGLTPTLEQYQEIFDSYLEALRLTTDYAIRQLTQTAIELDTFMARRDGYIVSANYKVTKLGEG
jgi:hypothetical protein